MLKVCHIANWYPNKEVIHDGIFIQRHIDAVSPHVNNYVFHLHIKYQKNTLLRVLKEEKTGVQSYVLYSFLGNSFLFKEVFGFIWMMLFLKPVLKKEKFDAVVFHIAGINARFLSKIKKWYQPAPTIIVDQWTAYYRFFHLPHNHPGLERTKRIFKPEDKIITVSAALANDIKKFSGVPSLRTSTMYNVVDNKAFCLREEIPVQKGRFFMLTNWGPEKRPVPLIKAFVKVFGNNPKYELVVGGDGVQMERMRAAASRYENVTFLGRISPEEATKEFNKASLFVLSTGYETFSVATGEALVSGCPVLVSNIPCIMEYLSDSAGYVVPDFEVCEEDAVQKLWEEGFEKYESLMPKFNRKAIREKYAPEFSKETIGLKFYNYIKEEVNNKSR